MRTVDVDGHCQILRDAFNLICDPNDWKGPIDALVPASCWRVYVDAVSFMTGTECEVFGNDENGNNMYLHNDPQRRSETQLFRIKSIGYRAGPAGG